MTLPNISTRRQINEAIKQMMRKGEVHCRLLSGEIIQNPDDPRLDWEAMAKLEVEYEFALTS